MDEEEYQQVTIPVASREEQSRKEEATEAKEKKKQLVAHTSSQDSSLNQLSPPHTPAYGLGMFALKKRSMVTRRNLLQKLDSDFQVQQ